jgi:hypothetical protein
VIDFNHQRAIEAHVHARDYASAACKTCFIIAENPWTIPANGSTTCDECGTVHYQATDPVPETEGMGGLVAAMLICVGAVIGAAFLAAWLHLMGWL